MELTGKLIVRFRADNEFDTKAIDGWLAGDAKDGRNCLEPKYTAPDSSHHNGGSGRSHQANTSHNGSNRNVRTSAYKAEKSVFTLKGAGNPKSGN